MKLRRNLLIALSLLSLSANAQRIKGSDTVLPVAQQTAERFMNLQPDARVTVTGGGTGVGISIAANKVKGENTHQKATPFLSGSGPCRGAGLHPDCAFQRHGHGVFHPAA